MTAQFWVNYMEMAALALKFLRATKKNDMDLHLAALQDMLPLFFVYDRHNYARYATVYLISILSLNSTHPGAEELLCRNGFSVSRSDVHNAVDKLIKEGKRKLARKFNLSYRYTDDLISFNNKRFKEFISDIYPKELTISETTEPNSIASYLDLLFIRDKSNNITTKLYDKRDAFGFHIVNFPFMSSTIPSAPAYGVHVFQLIRYAHCCSNYKDFLLCHRALVTRLLSQGYKVNRLSITFKKFCGKHTDLVGQYKKHVCQMFADSIS